MCEYFSENAMPWLIGMSYKAIRTRRHKYIHWTQKSLDGVECDELYDLKSDPYEMHNLIGKQSERPHSRAFAPPARQARRPVGRTLGGIMALTKRALLAATLVAASGAARAQVWPAKPLRLIVPLAPGATADIVARMFAEELGKALGQTVVVDNKTGAGGTIATAEAARAPADGYTLVLVSQGTMVFNIGLYKAPGYDPLKDLRGRGGRPAACPIS